MGNYFHVEEGCGAGFAFEFDPDHFVRSFKLDYVQALAAIEVLQVAGYLECTTSVHARSRISFLVLRDQLYKIDLHSVLAERLVESVLRTYAGIFVQYAYIDEQYLAEHLGVTRDDIYHTLLDLAKRRLSVIFRVMTVLILYTISRVFPFLMFISGRKLMRTVRKFMLEN